MEVHEKKRAGSREADETRELEEDDWGEGQSKEEPWQDKE